LFEPRNPVGSGRNERLDSPRRQNEPRGGGDQCEDEALGEELPDHPAAARAKRRADRHLAGPGGPAREKQIGDVAAGDQEDESHRPEQDEQALPVIADQLLHHRRDREAPLRIVSREAPREVLSEARELRFRLRYPCARLEARVDLKGVLVVHPLALGGPRDRHPQLFRLIREVERRRHDADDFVRPSADADLAAHDLSIRAEATRP
jgi:hypothetical protein